MSENKNIGDKENLVSPINEALDKDTEIELSSEARKLAAKLGASFGTDNTSASTPNGGAAKQRLSLLDVWFYYKWYILIALFFITIFTVLIVQSVTRERYDVRVLYAGPAVLSDTGRDAVRDAFSQQIDADYNGDGKISAELFDIILMNNDELKAMYESGVSDYFLNPSVIKDNQETLSVNAMAGDYVIFLIDVDYYKNLHDNGVFIPLDEMGITSGVRYDECSIYLNSLDVAKFYTAFNVFPTDTLICVKRLSANVKEKNIIIWEENKRYFKKITDFKLPEGFQPAT